MIKNGIDHSRFVTLDKGGSNVGIFRDHNTRRHVPPMR
jgi:hypothetical protein